MRHPLWRPTPALEGRIAAAVSALESSGFQERTQLGLVLGSGLGDFVDRLVAEAAAPFTEVPGFAGAEVKAHAGRIVQARLEGEPLLVLQGRPHAYEGLSMGDVILPVATMARLGCRVVVLTNAAGGLRPGMRPGELAVLDDLIDLHLVDVARGNLEPPGSLPPELFGRAAKAGPVFDPDLVATIRLEAGAMDLHRAVYASMWGPHYEEPATIAWLRSIGADVVGMSTGPEAAYLHAVGVKVAGISCITNVAAGNGPVEVSHDEVVQVGGQSADAFSMLLAAALPELGRIARGDA